eukprot:TRINITY_DN19927_c0_g1_i1.p1 TRINITY_DN19927_c0_g1~~TRINITY_DN19927_c0_g1_i1.p1  ORF type:complete len:196 (-),score=16.46 TRINITY_DN19927_c0_g1_i1:135-722(-)
MCLTNMQGSVSCFYFFQNDTATTEIYTLHIVGSVRCVQETGINAEYMGKLIGAMMKMVNIDVIEYIGRKSLQVRILFAPRNPINEGTPTIEVGSVERHAILFNTKIHSHERTSITHFLHTIQGSCNISIYYPANQICFVANPQMVYQRKQKRNERIYPAYPSGVLVNGQCSTKTKGGFDLQFQRQGQDSLSLIHI